MTAAILANAGFPMIVVIWPASWVLFVPVVMLEWWVALAIMDAPPSKTLKTALLGNVISTLIAIPLAWAFMVLIGMFLPAPEPDGFAGSLNNVLLHSAWLYPWPAPRPWLVPAAALFLCVPFFFASVFTEYWVANWILKPQYPSARTAAWAWRANAITYAGLGLFLAVMIFLRGRE